MGVLAHDIRSGLRTLRSSPAFTLFAIATLALGIGMATAIASLADALFLRPVTGADMRGVVEITELRSDRAGSAALISHEEFARLRDGARSLEGLAAHYSTSPLHWASGDVSAELNGAVVTASYFQLLGVRPALGRFFTDEEDRPGVPAAVAVLSDGLWQSRFRSDPGVLGQTIELNGVPFTIVGIARPDFHGVDMSRWNDVWIPMSMLSVGYRWCTNAFDAGCTLLRLFGRLRPGVSAESASADLRRIVRTGDDSEAERGVIVRPMRGLPLGFGRTDDRRSVALLMSTAILLLVIACANLAGTLLARGVARSREIAIRLAIGAGPRRVMRQLLIEGVLLALGGGIAGIMIAQWLQPLLASLWTADPEGYVNHLQLRFDAATLAFTLALSLCTGIAFSLLPALRSVRIGLNTAIRGESRTMRSRLALRDLLSAAQIAFSFPALACAGVLAASMLAVGSGGEFDASHVALMRLRPRLMGRDSATARRYTEEVLRRLEAMPAVRSASLVGEFGSLWGQGDNVPVQPPGQPPVPDSLAPRTRFSEVAPHFFETLGITLLEGREFDDRDAPGAAPVIIVNSTFVRQFLPDGQPIGRIVDVNGVRSRIVGVIPDVHFRRADQRAEPMAYAAWRQDPSQIDARVAVRVAGEPAAILPEIVRTALSVDPEIPVSETLPLDAQIDASFKSTRLTGSVLFWAAILAVALSALGVYGTLMFAVNARRRELAIRAAIGAGQADVARAVFGRTAVSLAVGLAAGIVLAFAATRLLAHIVYGTRLADPKVFAASALLLSAVIMGASWLPARAAIRVPPRDALLQV